MALKLVTSASLLDLGFSDAPYLTYQLTDFMEPGLYSENDNPLLVKKLTHLQVTRHFSSVLLLWLSVLSEINLLSQNPLGPN